MIRSFKGRFAEAVLAERRAPKGFPADLLDVTRRKLVQLNAAAALVDLRIPPGNRLEALRGDLVGYHSIRINDQWRIIFRWDNGSASDVEIIDYH
jgi:proteic killer suppression protein